MNADGDAVVAYQYTSNAQDIYAQKMDLVSGDVVWATTGVPVQFIANNQTLPTILPDGTGQGAIIIWLDSNAGWVNIRAQHLGATGNKLWTVDGVRILEAAWDAANFSAVPDGQGGAIIAWLDQRAGKDIYAQRVDAEGTVLWQPNGIVICNHPSDQKEPSLEIDGMGGAVITWSDRRVGNWDIYAQRVTSLGAVMWPANGTAICTYTGNQQKAKIARCGEDKWAIAWSDNRDDTDIYAQIINVTGNVLLATDGIPVCNVFRFQDDLAMVSYEDSVIIAWKDDRFLISFDVFIQRMSASGEMAWPNGTYVCANGTSTANQDMLSIDVDSDGNMYVAWRDNRNGNFDVYYQKVLRNGSLVYHTQGYPVCAQPGDQVIDRIACDGAGGAYIGFLCPDDAGVKRYCLQHLLLNHAPFLSSPGDISVVVGQQASLKWTVSDAAVNQTTFMIDRNATTVAAGAWTTGTQITAQIDTSSVGNLEYTIIVADGYGLLATDTARITIVPDNTPITIAIIVLCAAGGAVALLFFLDKKKVIDLKRIGRRIRGLFLRDRGNP